MSVSVSSHAIERITLGLIAEVSREKSALQWEVYTRGARVVARGVVAAALYDSYYRERLQAALQRHS